MKQAQELKKLAEKICIYFIKKNKLNYSIISGMNFKSFALLTACILDLTLPSKNVGEMVFNDPSSYAYISKNPLHTFYRKKVERVFFKFLVIPYWWSGSK
jgi:hypothetical protein